MSGWEVEIHELSEGPSAVVYDEFGQMVADHMSEGRARLVAASPDLYKAAKRALAVFRAGKVHRDGNNVVAALEDAITKASGGVA